MSEDKNPTVIRATDAHWDDRRHHDRLALKAAEPDRMYQFEGWVRFGANVEQPAFNIIAGVSRQDRDTGRLTVFVETHAGRWKPIGHGGMRDPTHLVFSLHDAQGMSFSVTARILPTLSAALKNRLLGRVAFDENETAQLDLDIQSHEERRSHFKVV